MNKAEIYKYLDEHHISYIAVNHPPAYTVEDITRFNLPHPECGAKNLFLRDEKKRNYYLLTVKDDTPVNIKRFQEKAGTRRLSFASEADLMDILGLIKGAVTPFGILNDKTRQVKVYIDSYFQNGQISVHPNDNTATIYLAMSDLLQIIQDHGNPVEFFAFEE